MSEKLQGTPNDFQEIKDPAEADSLLLEAFRGRAQATIWTQNQKHTIKTQLNPGVAENGDFSAKIPEGFKPVLFTREIRTLQIQDFYFNLTLSRANIFFKTHYVGFSSKGLHFRKPEKVFKVQRRKDLRVTLRETAVVRIEFWNPSDSESRMTQRIFDISASGVSFLVGTEEAGIFKADLPLHEMTFALGDRAISVDGIVRHTRPQGDTGRFKVGVEFQRMKAADTQQIAKFVLDENIRLISRFL